MHFQGFTEHLGVFRNGFRGIDKDNGHMIWANGPLMRAKLDAQVTYIAGL